MAGENRGIRTRSRRMAVCGMMAALGTVLLLAGALPFAAYCAPVLAMLPLLPVRDAYGDGAALGVYGVTAALGLLLSAEGEAALLYLFLGHYPVLRYAIGRLPGRGLRLAAKLAVCNVGVALTWGGALLLFRLPIAPEGEALPYLLTLLGLWNVTFLLLDRALGRLETVYQRRWRRRLFPGKE